MPSEVALFPSRAGSQRVPRKNIRPLAGHPLLAYAIAGARESGLFDAIVVSTDSDEIAAVARHYGAEVPWLRPAAMAASTSPDIEWVRFTLERLADQGRDFDEALAVANASPYGLTAAIWTDSVHRSQVFVQKVVAGGVQVNGPTYGFEPHVPFGGQRDSGTGWREPGTEALDVYSDWKTVYMTHDPASV